MHFCPKGRVLEATKQYVIHACWCPLAPAIYVVVYFYAHVYKIESMTELPMMRHIDTPCMETNTEIMKRAPIHTYMLALLWTTLCLSRRCNGENPLDKPCNPWLATQPHDPICKPFFTTLQTVVPSDIFFLHQKINIELPCRKWISIANDVCVQLVLLENQN